MADHHKHPVLLVDDEGELLYSLRGLLRNDFDVRTAESGREALEILARQPIHVVMSDQRMPEMTGAQLLTRTQELYPDTIRIIFTGYADLKAVIEAVNQAHIYRYITKPWDPDDLVELLHQACQEYDATRLRKQLCSEIESCLVKVGEFLAALDAGPADSLGSDLRSQSDHLKQISSELLAKMGRAAPPEKVGG